MKFLNITFESVSNQERKLDIPLATLDTAGRYFNSILQNIITFNNVSKMYQKLIIINIFGIAQTQTGNILVLAAVYKFGIIKDKLNTNYILVLLN